MGSLELAQRTRIQNLVDTHIHSPSLQSFPSPQTESVSLRFSIRRLEVRQRRKPQTLRYIHVARARIGPKELQKNIAVHLGNLAARFQLTGRSQPLCVMVLYYLY